MADGDAAQHLPVVERAERADPGVGAERGKRLADAHHVGFGHADVQGAPLIDGGDAGLEAARRRQVGVDRHHARIARKHLHRGRDDVAGRVFLRAIEHRQLRRRRTESACLAAGTRVVNTGPMTCERDSVSAERRTSRRICPANSTQRFLQQPAVGIVVKPVVERDELTGAIAPLVGLKRHLLLEQPIRHRHLVLVQKVGERAVALRPVADDRRRLAVARPEPELLERGVDAVVLRGVDAVHLPVERSEDRFQIGHREDHPVGHVELAVVAIDHHAQVVQVLLAREHHRFPDRPFLHFPVAAQRSTRRSAGTCGRRSQIPARPRNPGPSGPVAI